MKTDEFHKPFIKSLFIIAIVTMFAMVLSDKIVKYYSSQTYNSHIFTSHNSYNEAKAAE
jgi:hypothetical protein